MSPRQKLITAARNRAEQIAAFCDQALDQLMDGEYRRAKNSIDSALCRVPHLQRDLVAAQIAEVTND